MDSTRLGKQELADAVVEAATYVLQDILSYPPTRGQIQITPLQFTRDDLTVVARVSGDLTGEFFFGMSRPAAIGVVSRMLGRPVEKLGALEISALSELGSLITDSALGILEERGALCYATWASVILGQDERATVFALPTLAVPLRMAAGDLNVNVMVEGYAPFDWAAPAARLNASAADARSEPLANEKLPMAA